MENKITLSQENKCEINHLIFPSCPSKKDSFLTNTISDWAIDGKTDSELAQAIDSHFYFTKIKDSRFNYVSADSLDKEDVHIYYIPITNPLFFHDNRNEGFRFINKRIKQDIKYKRCKIVLHMLDDGVSGSEFNDDLEIIEKWRIQEKFPVNSIYYYCLNLKINENCKEKKIGIIGVPSHWTSENYLIEDNVPTAILPTKEDYKLFLNYNRNPHRHRFYFFLRMFEEDILKDGLVSFTLLEDAPQYSEEEIRKWHRDKENEIDEIVKLLPMRIDGLDTSESTGELGQLPITKDFSKTFLSIVSESMCAEKSIYLSEKTFKPILMKHPFMLIASRGSIKKLKETGYKTFDKWWDESYDDCITYQERIEKILIEIKKLKLLSFDDLIKMRLEMSEILEHNRKLILNRMDNKNNPLMQLLIKINNDLKNEKNTNNWL